MNRLLDARAPQGPGSLQGALQSVRRFTPELPCEVSKPLAAHDWRGSVSLHASSHGLSPRNSASLSGAAVDRWGRAELRARSLGRETLAVGVGVPFATSQLLVLHRVSSWFGTLPRRRSR